MPHATRDSWELWGRTFARGGSRHSRARYGRGQKPKSLAISDKGRHKRRTYPYSAPQTLIEAYIPDRNLENTRRHSLGKGELQGKVLCTAGERTWEFNPSSLHQVKDFSSADPSSPCARYAKPPPGCMVLECKDLSPELQVLTAIKNIMKDCSFNQSLKDVMELYVGLALAKENPQAARPMDPDLRRKYLVRLPTPHPVKLEVLSYSSDKLRTLASSIAASGMPPTQYLTRGLVGILLPVAPTIHRNCFPGIGYVTCPAIENECHPVATLLHVMGICVVLSWLRPQEEMRPWWLLLEELAPGVSLVLARQRRCRFAPDDTPQDALHASQAWVKAGQAVKRGILACKVEAQKRRVDVQEIVWEKLGKYQG